MRISNTRIKLFKRSDAKESFKRKESSMRYLMPKKKNLKESRLDSNYSVLWKDALELALEELESDHYGDMNTSEEMYFYTKDKYGNDLGYEGFAAFNRIDGDKLILNTVYPDTISVLPNVESFLLSPEEPDVDVSSISSEEEKEDALSEMDDYIDRLEEDKSALKDWQYSDESVAIAEEMSSNGHVEELEIELPDDDYIDFDEYEDEDEAILDAMKDEIVSALTGYVSDVSSYADDIQSDARIEVGEVLDNIMEKINDAEDKRKEIDDVWIEDMDETVRRRNIRRVIESKHRRFPRK